MSSTNDEKDPLLDELEERIAEGPVMFTPDEEFLRRVADTSKEINEKEERVVNLKTPKDVWEVLQKMG